MQYLTTCSENTLLKEQDSLDIRSLRRDLLTTALKYYEEFVSQRSDDPHSASNWPSPLSRRRDHPGHRVIVKRPFRAYRSALDLWEPLVKGEPQTTPSSSFASRTAISPSASSGRPRTCPRL